MTNHEWLKSMSVDDFSKFVNDAMICEMPEGFPSEHECENCIKKTCIECITKWLNDERETENNTPCVCNKEEVNHPSHYNRENALECIEEMLMLYTKDEVMAFCKLNAHKYRYRAGQKEDGLKDLKKSDWYLRKYKEILESNSFNKNNFAIKADDYPISLCVDRGV